MIPKNIRQKPVIFLILFFLVSLLFSSCNATSPVSTPGNSHVNKITTITQENTNQEKTNTTTNESTTKGISNEQTSAKQNLEKALCVRVIDGDTIVVLLKGREEKVRLIGIDTPERNRPYFNEATKKTASLVLGKEVALEKDISERDRYGRLLRYVYVDNIFVNAELVRLGYATVYTYPPDIKYADYFLKLQREAREARRGLWGIEQVKKESPSSQTTQVKKESPSSQTTQVKKESPSSQTTKETFYVASKRSDVFHYPWCQWAKKIASSNLIVFKSREKALASGRRPCRVCNP
jgi:micrococcal nuclease